MSNKIFTVKIGKTYRYLIVVILILCALSLAGQTYRHSFGLHKTLKGLLPKFDVDKENNVPTWFSSTLLLVCSVILYFIYIQKKVDGDLFSRHWGGLAFLFLCLSLDEAASIHELTELPLRRLLNATGYLTPTWVILGIIFCLVIVLVYCKFLLSIENRFKYLFLISGSLYLAGALGFEMIGN